MAYFLQAFRFREAGCEAEDCRKGGGVAAWFGGEMVDKDYNDGSKTPANTIFRFDGSAPALPC